MEVTAKWLNILGSSGILWYDSVTRVGASKEGLLTGPLETVVVLPKGKVAKNAIGVIIAYQDS